METSPGTAPLTGPYSTIFQSQGHSFGHENHISLIPVLHSILFHHIYISQQLHFYYYLLCCCILGVLNQMGNNYFASFLLFYVLVSASLPSSVSSKNLACRFNHSVNIIGEA